MSSKEASQPAILTKRWGAFPFLGLAHGLVVGSIVILGWIAVMAVGVRMLPYLFDPLTPPRASLTLARGLIAVAVEAAFVVGWPLGWALGAARWVERGEALALQALGEPPLRTTLRLVPVGLLFGASLVFVSFLGARDATEPGRVLNDVIHETRAACAHASTATTYSVPLTNTTWLCSPGESPRLVGRGSGGLHSIVFSAGDASVAGDLRRIELVGASLVLPNGKVEAREVVLRGLAPWVRASFVPPWSRALTLLSGAFGMALAAAFCTLRGRFSGRFNAIVLGTLGPIASLGCLRWLEKSDARLGWFGCVPLAGIAVVVGIGWALSRLPARISAATR